MTVFNTHFFIYFVFFFCSSSCVSLVFIRIWRVFVLLLAAGTMCFFISRAAPNRLLSRCGKEIRSNNLWAILQINKTTILSRPHSFCGPFALLAMLFCSFSLSLSPISFGYSWNIYVIYICV